jgi:hypothetical protein
VDAGANWNAVNTGLTNNSVRTLAINPTSSSIVYAGTYGGGIFKSVDAGANWSADNADLTDGYVYSLAINPTSSSIVYAGTYSHGVFKTSFWVGDFNGDGNPDILWRNTSTGLIVVWYMNGGTIIGSADIAVITGSTWQIVGTGDFNGDGKADILWRNTSTGANEIWEMNGATVIGVAIIDTVSDQNWKIVGPK